MIGRALSVLLILAQCATAVAQPAPSASAPAQHALARDWRVLWTLDGSFSTLQVNGVTATGGVTQFDGTLTNDTETCPIRGSVIDKATVTYLDGIEASSMTILAYVSMMANCADVSMRLDLLGLPEGSILMSGRAVLERKDGSHAVLPIALTPIN